MDLSVGHVNLESLTQLLVKGHRASRVKKASACPSSLVPFLWLISLSLI